MISKLWKDPVWSKVIAAGILGALGIVGAFLFDWWPAIIDALKTFWSFLGETTPTWNWLLGVTFVCTAFVAFSVMYAVWNTVTGKTGQEDWASYTSDVFFGAIWHWKWIGGRVSGLYSCCKECHYQVDPSNTSGFHGNPHLGFECENCEHFEKSIEGTGIDLEIRVKRSILHKIRTSEAGGVEE